MRRPEIKAQTDVSGATSLEAFMAGAGESPQNAENRLERGDNAPEPPNSLDTGVKRPGRPSMAPEEKLSERVQIKLTSAELELIQEAAGMVPISRFLRAKLQDAGVI